MTLLGSDGSPQLQFAGREAAGSKEGAGTSSTAPVPTEQDVVRIAAIQDHVIRNLEITACYSELAAAARARLGAAADWCTFATWASRQAGSTIRGEDLHKRLNVFVTHLQKVSRSLGSAVDAFNASVGSMERNVLPQARKFTELGAAGGEMLPSVDPVEQLVRPIANETRPAAADEPPNETQN